MQVSDIKTRLLGCPHRKCTPGRPSSVYRVNGTPNILYMCFKAPNKCNTKVLLQEHLLT